jgi:Coenzyme PQQ synthesis protein D (PqqD)
MEERTQTFRPKARTNGLVVRELPEEVLVYDLERHAAVCLNRTAAFVWKRCDGRTSVRELSRSLGAELRTDGGAEELVWLALEQLGRDRLLGERVARPAALHGMTRRELVRRLGLAAAASLPLVTSILAPTAAQAASCKQSGQSCTAPGECCSGLCPGAPAGTCT